MKRKSKIIISITGIFLVVLILSGLTYAYFLTNIIGNTNSKSVSVTTANLQLVYNDGNGTITGTNIVPGTTLDEKAFSVTNTGNVTVSYGVYIEDVINEFERLNDVTLSLTCTSSKPNTTCDGINTTFPDNNRKIVTNDISSGETQSYTLEVEYIEANVDQSVDMNKRLEGKVQIYGDERITLEFNVANSLTGDYGVLQSDPKTSYATLDGTTGTYRFVGVPYGSHTLTIYNSEGTIKGSSPISVATGNSTSVVNTNITVPDITEEIIIPVTITNETLDLGTVNLYEKNNPYKVGTLANRIVHNAQYITEEEKGLQYAEFTKTPITAPMNSILIGYYNYAVELPEDVVISMSSTQQLKYGTSYTISNSKITINDLKTCGYNEEGCIRDSINNGEDVYLTTQETLYLNSNGNGIQIYKVIDAEETNDSVTLTAKELSISYSLENILTKTTDDLGDSYYYRGDVTNNYLNFAGLCWRIVRIEGDGSVKIVLEDKNTVCNNVNYTGDWSLGSSNLTNYLNYYKDFQSSLITKINENYNTNQLDDYLVSGNWCISSSYNSYLNCDDEVTEKFSDNTLMFVSGLTAPETAYAGGNSLNNYLINNWYRSQSNRWEDVKFRTITMTTTGSRQLHNKGYVGYNSGHKYYYVRPSIRLKPGIGITVGNGTITSPYEIE